jgi:hypothetical protein
MGRLLGVYSDWNGFAAALCQTVSAVGIKGVNLAKTCLIRRRNVSGNLNMRTHRTEFFLGTKVSPTDDI